MYQIGNPNQRSIIFEYPVDNINLKYIQNIDQNYIEQCFKKAEQGLLSSIKEPKEKDNVRLNNGAINEPGIEKIPNLPYQSPPINETPVAPMQSPINAQVQPGVKRIVQKIIQPINQKEVQTIAQKIIQPIILKKIEIIFTDRL